MYVCETTLDQIWLGQTCSNETLNNLRWKNSEYQVWSSQQDLQLLHSSFSHLRNFYQTLVTTSWISYRLSKTMSHTCENWTIFCSSFLKWKNGLHKDCIYWWYEQTWYSKLFNFRQSRVPKTYQMESWPKQQLYIVRRWTNLVFKTFQFQTI